MVVAGAPPPTRTIERVETELGWEFVQIYGLTETAPLLTMNRRRAEWDDLDAGRAGRQARPGRRAGARRGDARSTRRRRGAGPRQRRDGRATGTSPRPRPTAIVDGWFHTGDGGFIDDEHYLTISDRKKDVIISGGENVSSIEVEDALFQHPAVAEVAVIGVPDEKWGETVKALVVLAPGSGGHRGRADRRTAASGWPHYKCPTSIEFRDELARTATGKLQKFKLREPYWAGRDRNDQLTGASGAARRVHRPRRAPSSAKLHRSAGCGPAAVRLRPPAGDLPAESPVD